MHPASDGSVIDFLLPTASPAHNLPALFTRFVGRQTALEQVISLLVPPVGKGVRLLTLLGTGGAGKTRLSIEVGVRLADRFPDGVWLVELAPLSDGTLLPQVVAEVLGVRERPAQEPVHTLVESLQGRRLLLILDNCEHLIAACRSLAETMLGNCPDLQIMATSREPLGVEVEETWPLPPLTLPDAGPRAGSPEAAESVLLFLDRARYRLPSFELTTDNAEVVAQICRQLDGIPLAVELAASRVDTLTLEEIAAKLDSALDILTSGRRGSLPRQQTLRAALDWSYDMLDDGERALFAYLSVFAGGFRAEEVQAVGSGVQTARVSGIVDRLVQKSLVVHEPNAAGGSRYRLLEPVRQYAREKLEAGGDVAAVEERHARAYARLAQAAEPALLGPDQIQWLDRLDSEHGNIRAALSWCFADSGSPVRAEMGLKMASSLWRFWHSRGHITEARSALERGLRVSGVTRTVRANALHRAGWHALIGGDFAAARTLLEESERLYVDLGDDDGLASVLDALGDLYTYEGDVKTGRQKHEEGLALWRGRGDRWGIAMALNSLSLYALQGRDREKAERLLREALVLVRALGDTRGIAITTHNLGMVALEWNDNDAAAGPLRESLSLFALQGNKLDSAYCLEALGRIAGARGDVVRAARLFGAAAGLRHDLEARLSPNRVEWRKAAIAAARAGEDEATWDHAWDEGERMPLASAVRYALSPESTGQQAGWTLAT